MSLAHPNPEVRQIAAFMLFLLRTGLADLIRPIRHNPAEPIQIKADEARLWWIGHATVLINLYGTTILTDPVLANWLPWPRRIMAAPYQAEDLPKLDFIVISHAHLDHVNKRTLRSLARKTATIILPRNCLDLIRGMGFSEIVELDWNQNINSGGISISSFKSHHWGLRYPWEKIDRGYNSYLFRKDGMTIFFAGDTAYGNFFKSIGLNMNIAVALLPIGAYNPPLHWRHMNPKKAVQAFLDLGARHLVPIHYNTFRLGMEPLEEPAQLLASAARIRGVSESINILPQGQSFLIS